MAVIYGRSGSTSSFNRKVGMGSIARDLVGDCMINCLTSSVLHGDSTDSDSAVAVVKAGGGRPSVAARTVRIYPSPDTVGLGMCKNSRSFGVMWGRVG